MGVFDWFSASWLLAHATYGLMVFFLLAAGFGLPFPEDIVLLTAGALIHRGATELVATAAVCAGGVLGGDLILFLVARHFGQQALSRPFFRKILPATTQGRLEQLFQRWGGGLIFVARHLAGVRAPVFALAGIHGMPLAAFLGWDALALSVSGPIMLTLGYLFSDGLDYVLAGAARVQHVAVFALGAVLIAYTLYLVGTRVLRKRKA